MSAFYRLDGLDGFNQALSRLDQAVNESTLRQAAVAGARIVHAETEHRAPVGDRTGVRSGQPHLPGFLRNHMLIAYDQEVSVPGKLASYIITWSKDAFYGRFLELGKRNAVRLSGRTLARAIREIEFGSSRTPAQPFMRPAFEAKKAAAGAKMAEIVERKLKEACDGQ